ETKFEPISDSVDNPESTFRIPRRFKQFLVFVTRDVRSKLTNTQYLLINLLEAPVLAFILAYLVRFYNSDVSHTGGYVYRENENIPAYLFMSVVVALFIGLTVSAEEIIRDRKILKRESFLNLSRSSYLLSKIFIMFSLSAIQTIAFVLVGNSLLGIKGMWADYWLVLFTTSCFANMLGLNISSAFNSAVTIYILIPFLIIPQLLLSGVIVKFEKLNPAITSQRTVPVAGEMMASRWAFEALAVNQFKNNLYEKKFYAYDEMMSVADFKKNYWIPHLRGKIDKDEIAFRELTPKHFQNMRNGNVHTHADSLATEVFAEVNLIRNEILRDYDRLKELQRRKRIRPISGDLSNQLKLLRDSVEKIAADNFMPSQANKAREYLNLVNSVYIKIFNSNSETRDAAIRKISAADEKKFIKLKNDYLNDNLSDLVRNANEFHKIVEQDGML
ncbi:MAG: ABC transporter permease, partial [Bacteroidia bacterium]